MNSLREPGKVEDQQKSVKWVIVILDVIFKKKTYFPLHFPHLGLISNKFIICFLQISIFSAPFDKKIISFNINIWTFSIIFMISPHQEWFLIRRLANKQFVEMFSESEIRNIDKAERTLLWKKENNKQFQLFRVHHFNL